MSRPNKEKISTEASPGSGLFAAFSGLEIPGLPESPDPKEAAPAQQQTAPAKKSRAILRKETAHRGGKTVIVVDGFDPAMSDETIEALGKRLRTACGCGGAFKDRTIELQGNQPDRIRNWLEGEGFRVGGIR